MGGVRADRARRYQALGFRMLTTKYRARPIEVEAVHFDVDTKQRARELVDWVGETHAAYVYCEDVGDGSIHWIVVMLRAFAGTVEARHGDWIVRGTDGDFHVCHPDLFGELYEPSP